MSFIHFGLRPSLPSLSSGGGPVCPSYTIRVCTRLPARVFRELPAREFLELQFTYIYQFVISLLILLFTLKWVFMEYKWTVLTPTLYFQMAGSAGRRESSCGGGGREFRTKAVPGTFV